MKRSVESSAQQVVYWTRYSGVMSAWNLVRTCHELVDVAVATTSPHHCLVEKQAETLEIAHSFDRTPPAVVLLILI